ncbi:hypothetical protein HK405_009400, partial [Cladochytrium tenue]
SCRNTDDPSSSSYRVRTDAELAEKLCDKLQALAILNEQRDVRVKCFLDKQNLTQGEDFQSEFMAGLKSSCLFLPLISEECLKSMTYLVEGGEDNVVREWEIAWDLRCKKEIDIVPILVGSLEHMDHSYRRFDAFGLINNIPGVMISNSPTNKTARETVSELFKLQGIFLNPGDLSDKITSILNRMKIKSATATHNSSSDRDNFEVEANIVNSGKSDLAIIDSRAFGMLRLSEEQLNGSPLPYPDVAPPADVANDDSTWFTLTNEWKEMPSIHIGGDKLPISVPAGGAIAVTITVDVSTKRYNSKDSGGYLYFSWISMKTRAPVVLDIEIEDIQGRKFGSVVEFVLPRLTPKERTKDDEFWLPCDFIDEAERVALTVTSSLDPEDQRDTPRDSGFPVARVKMPLRFMNVMVGNLRAIVCKAEDKHGRYSHEAWGSQPLVVAMDATETLAPGGSLMIGEVKTLATAFVDLRRRCVFAVRFELDNDTMHTVGFWPVPAYGDALVDQDAVEPVDAAPIPPGFFEAGVDWKGLEPTVLQGNVGLDKSFEQPKTPVNSRVNFAPNNSVGGDGSGGISGADLARIAEVVRAAVRTDLETLVRDTVRTEIAAAVERLERAISDASTATAVVTVRQLGRRLSASSHGEAPSPDD